MTQCYVLNNKCENLSQSEVQIDTNHGMIQASEVFQTEANLVDKLKQLDYTQNLNMFLLQFENLEDILIDIVEHLIKTNQMVFVRSSTYYYNKSEQTFSRPINNLLPDQHESEYYLLLFIKQFIVYYKKCISKPHAGQSDKFSVLNFMTLNNNNMIMKYNIVFTDGIVTTQIVTQVAEGLHCFEWNELNQYRMLISSGKHMNNYNDYALLLNDDRYEVGSDDPLLEFKRLIISYRSYYIQQLQQSGEIDNISSVSKMTMLRNTRFNFKPAKGMKGISLNGSPTYQLQFVENNVYFANHDEQCDQLFIREQEKQEKKSLISKDLKQYVKVLPDDVTITQILEQSKVANQSLISSDILYNSASLNDASREIKLDYVNQLVTRNQKLIKDMYKRLRNSEEILRQIREGEQQIKDAEIRQFQEKLGYINTKKNILESSFQISDLTQGCNEVVRDIYLKQLQVGYQYNKTLNNLCYINQKIDGTAVAEYTDFKALLQEVQSVQKPCEKRISLNEELDSMTMKQLSTKICNIQKQNVILRNKVQQLSEQITSAPQIISARNQQLAEKTSQTQTYTQTIRNCEVNYQMCDLTQQLKSALGKLQHTVGVFNLADQFIKGRQKEQKCYYTFRAIEELSRQMLELEFYTQDSQLKRYVKEAQVEAKLFIEGFGDFGLQKVVDGLKILESEV